MENKLPAFLFYANDFMGSTYDMELNSIGAYIKLLCYQWVNGYIPNDEKKIQKIISANTNEFKEIWKELKQKFILQENYLINKRLENIRKEALEFKERSSERGKKGADGRWHKQCTSNAQAMPNTMLKNGLSSPSSSPSSISISSSKEKRDKKDTPANAGTPQAEFVSNWKKLYKAKTGQDYKATSKDYVLVANLLKNFSGSVVLEKAKLLFELCQRGDIWFAKSMADFTIGKLSSRWNEIIEEVKSNGKQAGVKKSELESFLAGRE